ncbi:hypothetical protein [Caudoviricetes sp.]|nr:hypothetical protein [Caudoviricetes sp.]
MAKYTVRADSFIGSSLVKAGTVVELPNDLVPSLVWEPMDADAKKAVDKRNKQDPDVVALLKRKPTPQDPFTVPEEIQQANPEFFKDKPKPVETPPVEVKILGKDDGSTNG